MGKGKTEEAAQESATTYVKYTEYPGVVAERRIDASHLREIGHTDYDGPDLVFNKANNYMIDGSDLSPEILSLLKDEGFTISSSDRAPRLVGQIPDSDTGGPEPSHGANTTVSTTGATTGVTGTVAGRGSTAGSAGS